MKKIIALMLLTAFTAAVCSCSIPRNDHAGPTDPAIETVYSGSPAETDTETETAVLTSDITEVTPEASDEPISYIGAISNDEKETIMEFARDWYSENFSEYEVLSMKLADDDDDGYSYYSQYKPGELVILLVETTHGGSGVYRKCFITISDDGYTVINEGY